METAIALANVTRSFGAFRAVDALTLAVNRGEIFSLVGPDGAGKTTLLRLICGALEIDAGSIVVDGIDAVADPQQVQASVGYMPQRFSLYPDLSVMENLRFYGDIFGVDSSEFGTRSSALLEDFSLAPFGSRLAAELSGGMKQKLALACTLIHSPATILLDEPTAGVDPVSRREFWRILYSINRSGTTILVSTTYMDEAERAHRIGFMMRGGMVDCGSPQDLKDNLKGEVVEIQCDDRRSARRALHDDPGIRSVEIFGETLHALVDRADDAIPEIQRRLATIESVRATIRKIPPTLEDTFVARLTS